VRHQTNVRHLFIVRQLANVRQKDKVRHLMMVRNFIGALLDNGRHLVMKRILTNVLECF